MKFIDGWKLHVAMGIWKFIWTTEDRESPIVVGRFSTDRWFVAQNKKCEDSLLRWIVGKLVNEVITSGAQTQVVKSDQ